MDARYDSSVHEVEVLAHKFSTHLLGQNDMSTEAGIGSDEAVLPHLSHKENIRTFS
jgi:hypothetical protein